MMFGCNLIHLHVFADGIVMTHMRSNLGSDFIFWRKGIPMGAEEKKMTR